MTENVRAGCMNLRKMVQCFITILVEKIRGPDNQASCKLYL